MISEEAPLEIDSAWTVYKRTRHVLILSSLKHFLFKSHVVPEKGRNKVST